MDKPVVPTAAAAPPAPGPASPVAAAPAPKTVTRVAKVPANLSAPSLAMSAELLGRLTEGTVVIYDPVHGAKQKRIPLKSPRGIGALRDGSLVVFDAKEPGAVEVVHIKKGGAKKVYPATMRSTGDELLRVLPHESRADELWVLTPGSNPSLYGARLALVDGELDFTETLHPPAAALQSLTALADGSLYFLDGMALVSPLPKGKKIALSPELPAPVHLAAGADKDHAFVSTSDGAIHYLDLHGDTAKSVARIAPQPGTVYALAGAGGRVATILVDDSPSQALRFTLAVFDESGKPLLRETLGQLPQRPPVPPVSLVMTKGLVALGDAAHLAVYDLATGKRKLSDGGKAN